MGAYMTDLFVPFQFSGSPHANSVAKRQMAHPRATDEFAPVHTSLDHDWDATAGQTLFSISNVAGGGMAGTIFPVNGGYRQ